MDSRVGYTGGVSPSPTYKSVCAGDGHTEALRLTLNPALLSYEDLIRHFLEDPRVANVWDPDAEPAQYRTAIFVDGEEQASSAARMVEEVGKQVPILPANTWHDAEDWHQHFLGEFKDVPQELWDDDDDLALLR